MIWSVYECYIKEGSILNVWQEEADYEEREESEHESEDDSEEETEVC